MVNLDTNKEKLFGIYMTIYEGGYKGSASDLGSRFNRRCFNIIIHYTKNNNMIKLSNTDKGYLNGVAKYLEEIKYREHKSIIARYIALPPLYAVLLASTVITYCGSVWGFILLGTSLVATLIETKRLFKYINIYKERTRWLKVC